MEGDGKDTTTGSTGATGANGTTDTQGGAAGGESAAEKSPAEAVQTLGGVFNREYVEPGKEYEPPADDAGGEAAKPGGDGGGEAAKPGGAEDDATKGGDGEGTADPAAVTPKPGVFYRDGKEMPGNYVPEARVDELSRQLKEATDRLGALEKAGRPERPPEGQEPWREKLKPMPKPEDFQTTEEYYAAVADARMDNREIEREGLAAWRAEQEKAAGGDTGDGKGGEGDAAAATARAKEFAAKAVPAAMQRLKVDATAFNAQLAKLGAKPGDPNHIPISDQNSALLQGYIVEQGADGAALMYHLAGLPVTELQRIAALEPPAMLGELKQMHARMTLGMPLLDAKGGGAGGGDGGQKATGTRESKANDPPQTGGAGGVASGPDLDKMAGMSMDDYAKTRAAQEAEERKRGRG